MKFLSGIPVQTFCAYFDLKNANVFIYDGYIGPGLAAGSFLVNNAGTVATQTLTLSATAVGGSGSTDFDFLGAKSTVAWASTYTAAGLQASLVSIPTIGAGGVTVTGTTGAGPFTVTFAGVLASEPQTNLITVCLLYTSCTCKDWHKSKFDGSSSCSSCRFQEQTYKSEFDANS